MDLTSRIYEFIMEDKELYTTGNKVHNLISGDLSNEEKIALLNYTGAMFRSLNPRLRADKNASRDDKTDLKLIDNAFKKSKISQTCKVFRGISGDILNELRNFKENQIFVEKAFMSTTTDKKTAWSFARGSSQGLLEIIIPTGTHVISVKNISQFKNENEILINRGSKFKIIKYLKRTRIRLETFVIEILN